MIKPVFSILDRPGGRWLIAAGTMLLILVRRRELCLVRYDGQWVHRYRGLTVVDVKPTTDSPGFLRREVADIYFHERRPQPGDVVLDVGASVGSVTAVLAELVGPTGRVVAFEAHPATYACLVRSVALNGLTMVHPVNVAVSDEPGELFITDSDAHRENSIVRGADTGIRVRAETLTRLLPEHGVERVDFLKMNIEGAERQAIDGLDDGAGAMIRHAAISCHDFLADRDGVESLRTKAYVSAWFARHGFEVTERDDGRPWVDDTIYATRAAD